MTRTSNLVLDETRLTAFSKEFLAEFLEWKPQWKPYCSMQESPFGFNLDIRIPSPTGNPRLDIQIRFDQREDDIILKFAGTSVHGNYAVEESAGHFVAYEPLEVMMLIVAGDLVSFSDGDNPGLESMIMLTKELQTEDEITDSKRSGTIRIKSWDGKNDRLISVNNPDLSGH